MGSFEEAAKVLPCVSVDMTDNSGSFVIEIKQKGFTICKKVVSLQRMNLEISTGITEVTLKFYPLIDKE